jgi:hypothetical protein
VDKFFNYTTTGCGLKDQFCYPQDYNTRLMIFGDYTYRFNISLTNYIGSPKYIGEPLPPQYGYIRRVVLIRQEPMNANISLYDDATTDDRNISILFNSQLAQESLYQVDYEKDEFIFNFTVNGAHTPQLQEVLLGDGIFFPINYSSANPIPLGAPTIHFRDNGITQTLPINVTNKTQMIIDPDYFPQSPIQYFDRWVLRLQFNETAAGSTEEYNFDTMVYSAFIPAVVEVRIW